MSGYVKVVRGYGASFRIADCLNAPLRMTRQMSLVRYLGIDSFLTDTPMKWGYGPLLSHWHTISRFQLLYEAQVLILLGRCLRSAEYVYPWRQLPSHMAQTRRFPVAVSTTLDNLKQIQEPQMVALVPEVVLSTTVLRRCSTFEIYWE